MRRPPSRQGTTALAVSLTLLTLFASCGRDISEVSAPPLLGARSTSAKSTLDVNGTGSKAGGIITSNRGGIACTITYSGGTANRTGKCSQSYNTGTVVMLVAAPSSGAVLSSWVGCTAASDSPLSCEVALDQSRAVSAVFAPAPTSYTLTISGGASGSGKVTSTPAGINCTITNGSAGTTGCSANFAAGQSVTLAATSSSGSFLKAWAGAGCDVAGTGTGGSAGSCALSMSEGETVVVSFDVVAVVASMGKWDPPIPWEALAIHAHLLPDGRVMTWGRMDHVPVLWNPATPASFGSTTRPVDLFCSGHSFLSDGKLFVAGGHSGTDNQGIKSAEYFDFVTNAWSPAPDMQNGRWYPTNTTLAAGEILTLSGGDTLQQRNLIPEVRQVDGTWRVLSNASLYLPYYPFVFLAPDGRAFVAGSNWHTYWLNTTGTGQWTAGPLSSVSSRDYGSAVMYDVGKILIVGGGTSDGNGGYAPPTNTAETIDLNAGAAAPWRPTGSMAVARRQLNATLLADGRVLATGGTNGTGFNVAPTSEAVLAAEIWDPATGQWSTLARMTHYRLYHSTALLLPDGRVLSAGSGQPAAAGLDDDYTAEIYYPPYLFNPDGTLATRPTITSVPTQVAYGQQFTVGTPNASAANKVTWIRLGSVTHAFNEDQRMNFLSFSVSSTSSITVSAPATALMAPPGYYLLFLVDSRGVPSVAKIVRIS
jgi:hypothetical protein